MAAPRVPPGGTCSPASRTPGTNRSPQVRDPRTHIPALEAVGENAGEEQRDHLGEGPAEAHDPEGS